MKYMQKKGRLQIHYYCSYLIPNDRVFKLHKLDSVIPLALCAHVGAPSDISWDASIRIVI